MQFAIIGHLDFKERLDQIPKDWIFQDYIVSPEVVFNNSKGRLIALKRTAEDLISFSKEKMREEILDAAIFSQKEFSTELIQLGGFTSSLTSGGKWLVDQKEYTGYITHGNTYTTAVAIKITLNSLDILKKRSKKTNLAIIGAYGIIGEALSKILTAMFKNTTLIGRRQEKLKELSEKITGSFDIETELKTKDADIIITATSHPTSLLNSKHIKKNCIVVDISQPPNVSYELCKQRPDIIRLDGGFVNFPFDFPIPGAPKGKIFACMAEAIMQATENEKQNHIGSIDLEHLKRTEKWAEKYDFNIGNLTNFGKLVSLS